VQAQRVSVTDHGAALKGNRRAFLAVCTEILDQSGNTSTRDIYLYREGFYRGTTITLLVLAIGLLVYSLARTAGREFVVLCLCILLCVGVSLAFAARYRRFVRYRMASCLWGALVTVGSASEKDTPSR
jgi:hypothetical protein